jgi:hypothetical protein
MTTFVVALIAMLAFARLLLSNPADLCGVPAITAAAH